MRTDKSLHRTILGVGLIALTDLAAAQHAAVTQRPPVAAVAERVTLNIAAQPMRQALAALAEQTGLQFIFPSKIAESLLAPSLNGSYTAQLALDKLLENTHLSYEFVNAKTVTIRSTKVDGNKKISDASVSGSLFMAQAEFGVDAAEAPADVAQQAKSAKKSSDDVEEMIVEENRIKPFADRNVDAPRTINDQQPYYIFDSTTIQQSGAVNLEDFLKMRLTMNTQIQSNAQGSSGNLGNTSTINLRGLGADKTLILINGRRVSGVAFAGSEYQPDLNGIPVSAIDRVEVLPSSASGIYGGGAIGGVVNVVLKRDYAGGEVRLSYDSIWDADVPTRRVTATFGQALEGGKTNFMVTAQWADSKPLLFGHRLGLFERGQQTILRNSPTFFYHATVPPLGAAPNISPISSTATTLVLKDGRSLNSRNTTVPLGTAPGISMSALSDALFANRGTWNLDPAMSYQGPLPSGLGGSASGLLSPVNQAPTIQSVGATIRRQFGTSIEAFAEFSHQSNFSDGTYLGGPFRRFTVPASSPANPFDSDISVVAPIANPNLANQSSDSDTNSLSVGAQIKLPGNWIGQFDYTFSKNTYRLQYPTGDSGMVIADLANGTINPLVDTALYPMSLEKYLGGYAYPSATKLTDTTVRGAGPVFHLPWGTVDLSMALERRDNDIPAYSATFTVPASITQNFIQTYYPRSQVTDSAYVEAKIPLVARGAAPLLYAFDLQLSGRKERYTVTGGTSYETRYPDNPSRAVSYSGVLLNGQPYFTTTSYTSRNSTFGFKYQPFESVVMRTSWATAFLPPSAQQLITDPTMAIANVIDRRTGQTVTVDYNSGGNPDLKPQNSKSWDAGIIWEPKQISGLRFNAEYYRTQQFDQIGGLGVQGVIDNESAYPDRVTRNASGRITLVNASLVNLYKLDTQGWDFSFDYRFVSRIGTIGLRAVETYIMSEQRQVTLTLPSFDYAGFVGEGGPVKRKANASVSLERGPWATSWTTYYYDSYKQSGAAGGPSSLRFANGGISGNTVAIQGSQIIPSQIYHDLFLSYAFGGEKAASNSRLRSFGAQLLDGVTLQAGVRNVFNTIPPIDVYRSSTFYVSPFGDFRLRSYWINATKRF